MYFDSLWREVTLLTLSYPNGGNLQICSCELVENGTGFTQEWFGNRNAVQ